MSDIAKWALLVAGLVAIIALIVALPIFSVLNVDELTSAVSGIVTAAAGAFQAARGFINCFFTPVGRTILTVVINYKLLRWAYKWAIQVLSMAYRWIFK